MAVSLGTAADGGRSCHGVHFDRPSRGAVQHAPRVASGGNARVPSVFCERPTSNGSETQHSSKVSPSAVARRSQTNRPCMHVHHAHWQLLEFETGMRSGHMRQRARMATGRRPPPPCPRRPDPPHPIPPNPHFPCGASTEMKCSVNASTPTSNRASQAMQYMMEGHGQPYRSGQTYTHTRWYRSRRRRAECHIRTVNSHIAHNRTRYGAAIRSARTEA